jgi:hypothetical protein
MHLPIHIPAFAFSTSTKADMNNGLIALDCSSSAQAIRELKDRMVRRNLRRTCTIEIVRIVARIHFGQKLLIFVQQKRCD